MAHELNPTWAKQECATPAALLILFVLNSQFSFGMIIYDAYAVTSKFAEMFLTSKTPW